jgi:hypothetical protein
MDGGTCGSFCCSARVGCFSTQGPFSWLLGFATGLRLLPGQKTIDGINFDIHTLLFAALAIIIGFQAVNFAVFTKVFAVSEGLLPENHRFSGALHLLTLEVGLVVGGLLLIIGIAGSVYALTGWRARSFGNLDPTSTMRAVIPSVTALMLGFEIILSSFFLGILRMKRR